MRLLVIASIAALATAAPMATFAGGAGFGAHPAALPVLNTPHQGQQIYPQAAGRPQIFANDLRRPFAGYGYYGGPYSTLTSGTFDSTPPGNVDGGQVPIPVYGIPYYPPAPRACVRPLLIHIGIVRHHGKLPRVVYGTPPDDACAG